VATHWDAHHRVAAATDGGPETLAFAADHDGHRPPEIGLARRQRSVGVRADDPQTPDVEVRQGICQILDRDHQEMFYRPRRGFDGGRGKRCLAMRRVDDAVHTGCLCGAQQRPEVLGILERVEDDDERRFLALDRPRQQIVEAGELTPVGHEGDALVAVEPGQRGESSAFDLNYRDAEVRGMQDELLESQAALRDHEQADRLAMGDESLFDRVAPGDDFLVLAQQVARGRRDGRPRPAGLRGLSGPEWTAVGITTRTSPVIGAAGWTRGPAGRGEGLRWRPKFGRLETRGLGRLDVRRLGRFEGLRRRRGFGGLEAGYFGRQVNEAVVGGLGSGRALGARLGRALPEAEAAALGTRARAVWARAAGARAAEAAVTTRARTRAVKAARARAARARAGAASTRAAKATVWTRAVKAALGARAAVARAAEAATGSRAAGSRAAGARAGVPIGARSPRRSGLPFSRWCVTLWGLGVAIERRGVKIVGSWAAKAAAGSRAARSRAAESAAGSRAARARAAESAPWALAAKAAAGSRAARTRAAKAAAESAARSLAAGARAA